MSVIVTTNYEGETFEVEVFRDGSIDFPGRDFQYEKAMAEFYPTGSAIVRFFDEWEALPSWMIINHLWFVGDSYISLISEYVYHALDVMEYYHKHRCHSIINRRSVMSSINYVRRCVVSDSGDCELPAIVRMPSGGYKARYKSPYDGLIGKYAINDPSIRYVVSSAHSLLQTRKAIMNGDVGSNIGAYVYFAADSAVECADFAVQAVAHAASGEPDAQGFGADHEYSSGHMKVYHAESAWQVRRFVDVVEAIGQGLPWPDLGATT